MQKITNLTGRMGNQMFQYAYIFNKMRLGEIDDIYLQGEEHFWESADEIKAIYSVGIPEQTDMVAIHVRRGDYVNNPFYVDLTKTSYYERAMAKFPVGTDFLVFSDDIDWCKRQLTFDGCEFSEGSEVEDMNRMASCKGIIMANSSFSWWAAYLSSAKVIAPTEWHPDRVERTKLIDSWIKI